MSRGGNSQGSGSPAGTSPGSDGKGGGKGPGDSGTSGGTGPAAIRTVPPGRVTPAVCRR